MATFEPVTQRHDRVLIVLSGASLIGFDFTTIPADVTIITVNRTVAYIPRADYWVSIDKNVWKKFTKPEGTYYFYGIDNAVQSFPPRVHKLRRVSREHDSTLCENPCEVRTGNSGYAAENLAYHFHPRKIAFLGLDGIGAHFYDLTEPLIEDGHRDPVWYAGSLPGLFAASLPQLAARGIEVRNGSPESRVTCFPRCSPQDALDWIVRS